MRDLKDIFNLIRNESGRIFVLDESGAAGFVILTIEDYQNLKGRTHMEELSERVSKLSSQAEGLNRAILEAQMEDWSELEEPQVEISHEDSSQESLYIEPIEPR